PPAQSKQYDPESSGQHAVLGADAHQASLMSRKECGQRIRRHKKIYGCDDNQDNANDNGNGLHAGSPSRENNTPILCDAILIPQMPDVTLPCGAVRRVSFLHLFAAASGRDGWMSARQTVRPSRSVAMHPSG